MVKPDEITRGRLQAIDLLPPEADEAVAWAQAQVIRRQMTQIAIVAGLNERLRALGLPPVSRSAFGRWANAGLREGFAPRAAISAAPASNTGFLCPHCGGGLVVSAGLEGAVS